MAFPAPKHPHGAAEMRNITMGTALKYAQRGVAVFPLAQGTKVPLAGSRGHLDATTDPERIQELWQQHPSANLAAATGPASGFWVLDVDLQYGGPATLANLEAKHGPLPPTIEASTPSGGRHLYWRWQGPEIRNSAGRIGPGLDVRGAGGFITLPPSVRRDGVYRWTCPGPVAEAPAWLVEKALPPPPPPPRPMAKPISGNVDRYVAAAAANELASLGTAGAGQRNHVLNRTAYTLAGFVKAGALPEDWTRHQLTTRAAGIGLSEREIQRTIASAWTAALPRDLPR